MSVFNRIFVGNLYRLSHHLLTMIDELCLWLHSLVFLSTCA